MLKQHRKSAKESMGRTQVQSVALSPFEMKAFEGIEVDTYLVSLRSIRNGGGLAGKVIWKVGEGHEGNS